MLEAMEEHMPAGVRWTHPHGGLFLWLTMPEHLKSTEVLQVAVEQEKVACVPGDAFYPDNGGWNTMRLNFSYSKPTLINEGISRLGRVIKRLL